MVVVVVMLLVTGIPISMLEKEFIPETAMRIVRTLVRLERARSLDYIDELVDKVEAKLWAHREEWGVESMTAFFNRNFIEINMFLPVYELPKMPRNEVKERAKELLLTTDQACTEICFAVGYNNQSYFTRTFKNLVGVTPSQFRMRNRRRR